MDSLATNEEQAICVASAPLEDEEIEAGGAVASGRAFFTESDEVCKDLKIVVDPELPPKACREVCERIGLTWTQYQEQPGLLDPFLEQMIEPLIGAIADAVRESPKAPQKKLPNLHLLSSLLYLLTTVRGYKTVSRFFPHEAADLEPCLEAAEDEAMAASTQTWSTLYCLMLWLSMVLLTPFDLQSIDSGGAKGLSARILELGMGGLRSTSRTRDASAWMLAKYFTRPDVTVAGALGNFLKWTKAEWSPDSSTADAHHVSGIAFTRCGVFQAWSQMLKAVPRGVLKPVWGDVVGLALSGPSGQGDKDFGTSAALQQLRVKVACRAGLISLPPRLAPWRYERGQRSLLVNFAEAASKGTMIANTTPVAPAGVKVELPQEEEDEDEDVPEEVEEIVELLLANLSFPDTVVRWAAAKGVGRMTNRLTLDFGDQIIESLLERCFSFRETDKAWHGGCLALAELTRRGLLLPERLPTVVPLVCQALHFEQVVGNHAVGQHVRDAACYVCWAFARAYAPSILEPFVSDIANALIQVAVYDREINCRRAASAAVQEQVGRQGTFPNGIEVVTCADYFTLSVRRHAYLGVAPQLAALGYRRSLMEHLVDRKLHHQDLQIRLLASRALAKLAEDASEETAAFLNSTVLPTLLARASEGLAATVGSATAAANSGPAAPAAAGSGPAAGTVGSRHGAVAAVAALVDVLRDRVTSENQETVRKLVPTLEKGRAYRGRGGEVVRQASCSLLARIAAAEAWPFKDATCKRYLQTIDESVRHTTHAVQIAAVDALQTMAHLRFSAELCNTCVDTYIAGLAKTDEMIAARRGYALCLGALPHAKIPDRCSEIVSILCREAQGLDLPGGKDQDDPQVRQYAVLSLGRICMSVGVSGEDMNLVIAALQVAIADYAVDRRGDVGSWVREVAMEVITSILDAQRRPAAATALASAEVSTRLLTLLLQLGVEKLDRLRERAYGLIHFLLCGDASSAFDLELAYHRICHLESYDPVTLNMDATAEAFQAGPCSAAWPPAHADVLREALFRSSAACLPRKLKAKEEELEDLAQDAAAEKSGEQHAAIFDTFVRFLGYEVYRPAVARGLIVSIGGITESTAKEGRKALLSHLQQNDIQPVCDELLGFFDETSVKDTDLEAKRVLGPLFTTVGLLLAQDVFPEASASVLFEKALAAVRSSRDLMRLKSSIAVFVGLLRWRGATRRKAMSVLLQFLGYSFPVIRQATAQALYIRLLEESDGFDLSGDESIAAIPAAGIESVQETLAVAPWGTSNDEALAEALREVYATLKFDLPTGGRSILAPKKKKEAEKVGGNEYADLVRANHY